MATFTQTLKKTINDVFNESADADDFVQAYVAVDYEGTNYGKLPTVPNWDDIGLGFYPIFDENYRPVINGKIVDRFFNREIGTETPDMFFLMLRRRMNEIMPYYNQLYESLKIEFNPLDTMNIKSKTKNEIDNTDEVVATNTTEADATSESRAVTSSTPQTMLSGDEDYATGATDSNSGSKSNSNAEQNSTSTGNTVNNGESEVSGFQGVASSLLMRYRDSILNIDTMILDDLEILFMGIFDTSDSYFNKGWAF